ncbi:hypothetical protein [Paeniglutamicibacter terrestris]|uniref:Secreted protein n=1 Tax=Paeniglutamicibacter terrestris TaxID=2723403 RepID=A0ABX1G883_9MICC|nr:hypothetical protein [Paeniglutamicibacter terrestris]ASN40352.1 hypothetical protein CGQ24_15965 [Arthrobacter sp. 7749]NKG21755.1 hypothetical protein [Paeniglutamicibacter terrestris]
MKFLIAFIHSLMPVSGSLVKDFRFAHHSSLLTTDALFTANDVVGLVETELDSEKIGRRTRSRAQPIFRVEGPRNLAGQYNESGHGR